MSYNLTIGDSRELDNVTFEECLDVAFKQFPALDWNLQDDGSFRLTDGGDPATVGTIRPDDPR